MTNTFKLIAAATLIAATSTSAFAGNPEAVLNNQVEEPVVDDTLGDLTPTIGLLLLAGAVGIAAASNGGGGGSSTTTTTTGN